MTVAFTASATPSGPSADRVYSVRAVMLLMASVSRVPSAPVVPMAVPFRYTVTPEAGVPSLLRTVMVLLWPSTWMPGFSV